MACGNRSINILLIEIELLFNIIILKWLREMIFNINIHNKRGICGLHFSIQQTIIISH